MHRSLLFRPPGGPDGSSGRARRRCRTAVAVAAVTLAAVAASGCGGDDGGRGEGAGGDEGGSAVTPDPAAAPGTTSTVGPTTSIASTTPAGDGTVGPTSTVPEPAAGAMAASPSTGGDDCAGTWGWGTEPRSVGPMAVEHVYLLRPGRHACFDRVVFDVNGVVDGPDAVGFHVAYVDGAVRADGSGEPVPTAGDAALEVVVRAPALGDGTSGHQPWRTPWPVGDDLVTADQVAGWPVLREVRFAGSFEGQTTFAVGVDRRLPFRAGAFEDATNAVTHVYVDIARP